MRCIGRIDAVPTEAPEIPGGICPGRSIHPRFRSFAGIRCPLDPVDTRLIEPVRATLPRPFIGRQARAWRGRPVWVWTGRRARHGKAGSDGHRQTQPSHTIPGRWKCSKARPLSRSLDSRQGRSRTWILLRGEGCATVTGKKGESNEDHKRAVQTRETARPALDLPHSLAGHFHTATRGGHKTLWAAMRCQKYSHR
jgi:hypothetical protein